MQVVTFDLFSALLDSRSGGSAALQRIAAARAWAVTGEQLYDRWDALNKQAQKDCARWVPFAVLARAALAGAYAELSLRGNADADLDELLDSVPDWPLWPDVADGLPRLAARYRIGLLSNVDDALFRRTRAAALVDPAVAMTSERLGAYKPDRRIYERARDQLGDMVHVATSARDVRGALEAGIPVVRLRRPGHDLDPGGPRPAVEVDAVAGLADVLPRPTDQGADPAPT